MKIIKYKGGIGNQLFQYAFSKHLELTLGEKVYADLSYYNKNAEDFKSFKLTDLNVELNILNKNEVKRILLFNNKYPSDTIRYKIILGIEVLTNKDYYFESSRKFTTIDKLRKYTYLDGYWQSHLYLNGIEKILSEQITLKSKFHPSTIDWMSKMHDENSVFIGIRRGDYLKEKKHYLSFGVEYYYNAINYIKKHVIHPKFYIFSNEINWVKNNLDFDDNFIFRENNIQINDLEELFLMSNCKHAIISNSTFNWWGAWLIKNPDKIVIAPKNWFGDNSSIDIIPKDWIKI